MVYAMPGPDIVTSENNRGISIVDDLFDWRVAPAVPVPFRVKQALP